MSYRRLAYPKVINLEEAARTQRHLPNSIQHYDCSLQKPSLSNYRDVHAADE